MSIRACVGLFGTCGKTIWRDSFIAGYGMETPKVEFFNPQVDNWVPECAVEEANHLADDAVILFPVTKETYGMGSLAETGFSILQAIRLDERRDFVIMIENDLLDNLKTENPLLAKESLRARALVRKHLEKLRLRNVFMVTDFTQMYQLSVALYRQACERLPWEKFTLGGK